MNQLRIFLSWIFLRVRVIISGDDNDGERTIGVDENRQLRHFQLRVFVGGIWPLTFLWLCLPSAWHRLRRYAYFFVATLLLFLASAFAVNVLELSTINHGLKLTHLAMYAVDVVLLIFVVGVLNLSEPTKATLYALVFPFAFLLTLLTSDSCSPAISYALSSLLSVVEPYALSLAPTPEPNSHGVRGYFLALAVFLLWTSLWLLTRPLHTIRASLWKIGDSTSTGLDHNAAINYDTDITNIGIRIDNDETEQRLESLRRILSFNPKKVWTVAVESVPDYFNQTESTDRNWLYRIAWPLRRCANLLPSHSRLRALRVHTVAKLQKLGMSRTKSAVPLEPAPESDTLKLQLTAIARFSFQQHLLPRDASRATPLPASRDPYQDKTEHDGEWSGVAKDLLVSLRLHSFQLSLYLTLLATMFILVAYDVHIFQFHEDPKKHIIGPFLWSGFFLTWAIFSVWLRTHQIRALKSWAGRYRGHPFVESSPIFYFRWDRPEDKAWEELIPEDFDVEIKHFGIDHARMVEFMHAALLVIALYILEKLL